MSPAEAAVRDVYLTAQSKLNLMLYACKTDEERAEIKLQFLRARHNWQAVENQIFQQNDAALDDLVAKTNVVAGELHTIELRLGNIAEVINTVTQGATYGAQIVGKILAV